MAFTLFPPGPAYGTATATANPLDAAVGKLMFLRADTRSVAPLSHYRSASVRPFSGPGVSVTSCQSAI